MSHNENSILKVVAAVALVIAAIFATLYFASAGRVGASGSRFPNGISADSTSPSAGQVRGTTLTSTGLATLASAKVGTNGTSFSQLNGGTCYIKPYAATITASSTVKVDCQGTAAWNANGTSALTGVTAGDSCIGSLATSTAGTTVNGLALTGVSASTTPGFIELYISNLTGTTFTWSTSASASGTASYLCQR